jgi:hypothetical protein
MLKLRNSGILRTIPLMLIVMLLKPLMDDKVKFSERGSL